MTVWLSRLLMASLLVLSLLLVAGCSDSGSGNSASSDGEQTDDPVDSGGEEETGNEGDGSTGDDTTGAITPPFGVSEQAAGFRVGFLEFQHPHIIADTSVSGFPICADVTFDPLEVLFIGEVAPGLNPTLAGLITDRQLNLVQLHDPLDMTNGHTATQAVVDAQCDSATNCTPARDTVLAEGAFSVQDSAACLGDISGIYDGAWPDQRISDLNTAAPGEMTCYVTDSTTLELSLDVLDGAPLVLSLQDVRIAGRYDDDQASMITDGLILGFLSQVDADQVTIDINESLSLNLGHDLLPANGPGDGAACGARTHCAGPDARVTHNGDCGWWFALNFNALRLEDVSGF